MTWDSSSCAMGDLDEFTELRKFAESGKWESVINDVRCSSDEFVEWVSGSSDLLDKLASCAALGNRQEVHAAVSFMSIGFDNVCSSSHFTKCQRIVHALSFHAFKFPYDQTEGSVQRVAASILVQAAGQEDCIDFWEVADRIHLVGKVMSYLVKLRHASDENLFLKDKSFICDAWVPAMNLLHCATVSTVHGVRNGVIHDMKLPRTMAEIFLRAATSPSVGMVSGFEECATLAQTLIQHGRASGDDKHHLHDCIKCTRHMRPKKMVYKKAPEFNHDPIGIFKVEAHSRFRSGVQLYFGGFPAVSQGLKEDSADRVMLRIKNGWLVEAAIDSIDSILSAPAPGCQVILVGMIKRPELNGSVATLGCFIPASNRWEARLSDGSRNTFLAHDLSILPHNLIVTSSVSGHETLSADEAAKRCVRFRGKRYFLGTDKYELQDVGKRYTSRGEMWPELTAWTNWLLAEEWSEITARMREAPHTLTPWNLGEILRARHLSSLTNTKSCLDVLDLEDLRAQALRMRLSFWSEPVWQARSLLLHVKIYDSNEGALSQINDFTEQASWDEIGISCLITRSGILHRQCRYYTQVARSPLSILQTIAKAEALILSSEILQINEPLLCCVQKEYVFCCMGAADFFSTGTTSNSAIAAKLYDQAQRFIKRRLHHGPMELHRVEALYNLGVAALDSCDVHAAKRVGVEIAIAIAQNIEIFKREKEISSLAPLLQAQIARALAEIDGSSDDFRKALSSLDQARVLKEEDAAENRKYTEFGHIDDQNFYREIVVESCEIIAGLIRHQSASHSDLKEGLKLAKEVYAYACAERGLEDYLTRTSLSFLAFFVHCEGRHDVAVEIFSQLLVVASLLGEDLSAQIDDSFREVKQQARQVFLNRRPMSDLTRDILDVPTKCGHRACKRVGKAVDKFQTCGLCRSVRYCSPECQNAAQPMHEIHCKRFRSFPSESLRSEAAHRKNSQDTTASLRICTSR